MAELPEGDRVREVLVVEDNPADLNLTLEALRHSGFAARVSVVTDGEQAIHFLKQHDVYARAERPELVLLDGELPKISGYEVLAAMKGDRSLRQIPVIMLSSNASNSDVMRAYDGQIAAYIVKPFSFEEYAAAIKAVEELWFHRASLPVPHQVG